MAEALVLGTSAGQAAAKTADTKGRRPTSPVAVATRPVAMKPTTPSELVVATRNLRSLMWHFAGPVRTAEGLEEARDRLTEMAASVAPLEAWSGGVPSPELLDLRNLLVSSLFLVESALARPGSLGVHWRDDAPTPVDDPDLAYSTVEITQGEVFVEMRPVDFEYVHPPPLN